ncbi:MAG: hypothetical protein AMJ65_15010 [Phycisphaerae bacterium SG8_4]|nr:MAG: hypothetical protein AMJ65_15010 [Phycisphaerae bacterium SG8_4]
MLSPVRKKIEITIIVQTTMSVTSTPPRKLNSFDTIVIRVLRIALTQNAPADETRVYERPQSSRMLWFHPALMFYKFLIEDFLSIKVGICLVSSSFILPFAGSADKSILLI